MKKVITLFLALLMAASLFVPAGAAFGKKDAVLRLIVPENWELTVGDSRSVDLAALNTSNCAEWTAEPADVASVDRFGRVTALKAGEAVITAQNADGYTDSVKLTVVNEPTKFDTKTTKVDFSGEAVAEGTNLQKLVTRYAYGSKQVPEQYYDEKSYAEAQTAVTADGAKWEITEYGVLRTDENAANERDILQRFMGDRYFYDNDTTEGKVLAIFADGKNGIWTVMKEGFTHIEMIALSASEKAVQMSDNTQKYVSRRGMVSEAYLTDGEWVPSETDNDGLWTSMYAAGELMRYAVMKEDPTATEAEIEAARKTATIATEAVVLLTYISMRQGTIESNVRAQRNGSITDLNTGKYYTNEALIKGGDYSQYVPFYSPARMFEQMSSKYLRFGVTSYVQDKDNLALCQPQDWVDTTTTDGSVEFEKRDRLLEGFWARTYSFKEEKANDREGLDGYAYWSHEGNGTAIGISEKVNKDGTDFLLHGENIRGKAIDATGEIPERLWNDLIGSEYDISDIIYKGDTSSDEIIGHLFLYKLAYDILGTEDKELGDLIANTMDKFAQHISDNSYCLVDGSGQPTTWGKFSRTHFHNGQILGGAPLNAAVVLCAFKLAAYVTGNQKWQDEYEMAAFDPQYEYAKVCAQELERYDMAILEFANSASGILGFILRPLVGTKTFGTLYRMILNYSDEEMAMLAYYLLFQLEDDEEYLAYYREGIDDWWFSIKYSENPLWYYIYQLAYPDKEIKDYYGNNILDTASWALSRHPIDTRRYCASSENRDDIDEFTLDDVGIDGTRDLSFDPNVYTPPFFYSNNKVLKILGMIIGMSKIEFKVAAFDERSLHKYNGSTYDLNDSYDPDMMEGSTTYTLPYWMGRYHGMLAG